ncbi:MAG: glucosamine-6-phosphate deaminase, partial [Pedosphaera sp.]|nr:glucosamine-6-phosphate deaminase [Pedosphaera sp.]
MENNSLIRSFMVDALPVRVFASQSAMSDDAALTVHEYLAATLARQKKARVILATGNSQLRFLALLVQMDGVDWSR